MRDGHNGYLPSAGIPAAREAVAADYAARGMPVSPDRVLITTGTSEGDRPRAERARGRGRRGARPVADVSALHGGAREDRTRSRGTTGPIPTATGCPTSITCAAWSRRARACWSSSTRTIRPAPSIRPPVRRALIEFAEEHDLTILADEVYARSGLRRLRAAARRRSTPTRRSFRSRACRRRISRPAGATGWMVVGRDAASRRGRSRRSRSWRTAGSAARARCSTRSPPRSPATARTRRRSARRWPSARGSRRSRSTRFRACAASRRARRSTRCRPSRCRPDAPTRTTCSRCCGRPASSACTAPGFGMPPEQGSFRIVFLAEPARAADDLRRHRRLHAGLSRTRRLSAACRDRDSTIRRARCIRYALVGARAHAWRCSWALYLVRGALLLIYISALVAIGLAPLVSAIERRRVPRRTAPAALGGHPHHLPRASSASLVGVGAAGHSAARRRRRASSGRRCPTCCSAAQQWLIDRGLLIARAVVQRSGRSRRRSAGSDAVGTVDRRRSGDSSAASSAWSRS